MTSHSVVFKMATYDALPVSGREEGDAGQVSRPSSTIESGDWKNTHANIQSPLLSTTSKYSTNGDVVVDDVSLDPSSRSFYLPRRVIFALLAFWACLVSYAYRAILSIAILSMAAEDHPEWSETDTGMLLSSFFWGYIVPQIPGGWMATTYGGKRVLAVSVAGAAISAAITPLFRSSLPLLVACRIVTGLFEGVLYPTLHGLISKWSPPTERSRIATFIWSGGYAGTVLAMLTGPPIITALGWPFTFYIYGALGLMWTGAFCFFCPSSLPLLTRGSFLVFWLLFTADSPKAFHASKSACISIRADEIEAIVGKGPNTAYAELGSTPWKKIFSTPACWAVRSDSPVLF